MFTRRELAHFKECRRMSPWMGNCVITSEVISITDNMFDLEWRFFKYTLEGRDYYVIKKVPGQDDGNVESCTEETMDRVMKTFESMLWNRVYYDKPDLSKIPLDYILSAPNRLGVPGLTAVFLGRMLPYKTASIGN